MSNNNSEKWDLNGGFLTGKNAIDKSIAVICSKVRTVESKFAKENEIKIDRLVDLKVEDGSIKTLRLNKASQKALHNAGIKPSDVFGVEVVINVMSVLVRGELAKSIVINPTGKKVESVKIDGEEIKAEDLNF